MSYANRKQMSSNRTAAIIIVALIHIALGYALVTGLAYNVIKKAAEDLKTFDVEDEPPPPPEEPPPPPEQNVPPPPQIVAPPPIIRTNTVAPPIISTPVAPPPVITPRAEPAPPAPPAHETRNARSALLTSGLTLPRNVFRSVPMSLPCTVPSRLQKLIIFSMLRCW